MPRVLLAASGTGGHLFPARYIAEEIKKSSPASEILFIGSGRPLEAEIIDRAGFRREVVPLVGLKNRGLRGLFEFGWKLPRAVLRTHKIFKDFRPEAVVGVGGYVSVLPVLCAFLKHVPAWIHEAEHVPGLANKFLARFATGVTLAHRDAQFPVSTPAHFTGHPVRSDLLVVGEEKRKSPATSPSRLLVMGGSQGAKSLDEMIEKVMPTIKELQLEVLHQARGESVEKLEVAYAAHQIKAKVVSFIVDMPSAYRFADLIISRSGAGSVGEFDVVGLPSILVPLALGEKNEQASNAQILAQQGKAVVVSQGDCVSLEAALRSCGDPSVYQQMVSAGASTSEADAARKIAALILDSI